MLELLGALFGAFLFTFLAALFLAVFAALFLAIFAALFFAALLVGAALAMVLGAESVGANAIVLAFVVALMLTSLNGVGGSFGSIVAVVARNHAKCKSGSGKSS